MAKPKKNTPNFALAESVMAELDQLALHREEFEQADLARTNQRLYQILAGIYAQYEQALASNRLAVTIAALKDRMKKNGQRVQKNTPDISVFVRYVFNTDRQRIFNYACALQAAMHEGVKSHEFEKFVIDKGGIEECKVTLKKSEAEEEAVSDGDIADVMPIVEELLNSPQQVLASIALPPIVANALTSGQLTFLIGKTATDGTLDVINVVPGHSKSMEKWAKVQLAKFVAQQQLESEQKTMEIIRDEAIAKAAASAVLFNQANEDPSDPASLSTTELSIVAA